MESNRRRSFISRRKFLAAVAAGAGSLALAACGETASEGGTEGETVAGGDAPPSPAEVLDGEASPPPPTPTPVVLGQGGQQVIFWHGLGGADGATMVQMLQQYASENPEITISSETYGWDVFYQKLPTATAAGAPPNLGIMHSWGIQQFAAQGILQSADDLFFSEGLLPKDDFNASLIQEISADGKAMAVPFDYHGWINYVNTQVLEEAGLDPDDLPQNGTEFIEWAQQVVVDESGRHPNEDGFNPEQVAVWAIFSAWQRFSIVSTIWQFGGGIFSDDGTQSLLNQEQTIAAVQYWRDLIFEHRVAPPAVPGTPGSTDLWKGNALALMWEGTWNLNFFKDNPDAMEVMQPMYINSLAPDGNQAVRFDSHMMVVPVGVQDENLQAAKDLIVWLSENGETWATSGQVPARASVQQLQSVQDIPSVAVAARQFEEIGRAGQSHPAINEMVVAYEAAFSAVLAGTTPTEEAMNTAHEQVQSILDRY